jgi:hypothetical protein
MTRPNAADNVYLAIGDRWCSVEQLLSDDVEATSLLHQFAFHRLDPDFAFSACNLKAQYIPDEDFINDGSAIILYSLTGGTWSHAIRVKNQLSNWMALLDEL